MSTRTLRHQPVSQAANQRFPDPDGFSIVNCPYCVDAREQIGSKLAGCIRHTRPAAVSGLTETPESNPA